MAFCLEYNLNDSKTSTEAEKHVHKEMYTHQAIQPNKTAPRRKFIYSLFRK